MRSDITADETRRRVIKAMLVTPIALASSTLLGVAGCATGGEVAAALVPTPPCADDDDADPTASQTEGPYFTPNSPERTSLLETRMAGTLLTLTGTVVTRSCQPVAGALLDFWQADEAGDYDNTGYRLRGHQFTNASGQYRLETVVPGLYPGRTRHIHVKVQAPSRPVLTTQLYFPGESRNNSDRIFDSRLLTAITSVGIRREGRFDFVLDIA